MEKYKIELRHRARVDESFEEKHSKFMSAIAGLGRPWNLEGLGELPGIGSELLIAISLDKFLGVGIKGRLIYMYRGRGYLEDSSQYDDTLFVEFSSRKLSLKSVVDFLPVYIMAFECYRATVHNWEITRSDWPKVVERCDETGMDVNGRDGVYRINAINYFDRELCGRAFDLSPEEVVERLSGKVESVYLLGDGVFLVYSSQPLERQAHESVDHEVRRLLAG